jgi:hypothetical protein
MSSEKRCFNFILAAPRIVRIERAVRPCFPITLPTSLAATRNRRTVPSPSWKACTETLPGLSTSARAISVISSVILFAGSSPAATGMASVITYTSKSLGVTENRPSSAFCLVCCEICQDCAATSETPVRDRSRKTAICHSYCAYKTCRAIPRVYVKLYASCEKRTYNGSNLWEPIVCSQRLHTS